MRFNLLKNKEKIKDNSVLKIQKNNKKSQEKSRGRSMVEMLGVLAIIGVLSISAISGYTIAMRRYRANEILNVANKYAFIVWNAFQQQAMKSEGELGFDQANNTNLLPFPPTLSNNDFSLVYKKNDWNWHTRDILPFPSSGLGALPSGLEAMDVTIISSTASGIGLDVMMIFKDKALCESVKSMVDYNKEVYENKCELTSKGSSPTTGSDDNTRLSHTGYPLVAVFYQE